jgi:hypothetical protein
MKQRENIKSGAGNQVTEVVPVKAIEEVSAFDF